MSELRVLQSSMAMALIRGRTALESGPFTLGITEDSGLFWHNYAVPTGIEFKAKDIESLLMHFRRYSKIPRLELIEGINPDLEPLLLSIGFERQARMPVLLCSQERFQAHALEGIVELLTETDDPTGYFHTGAAAFGEIALVEESRVARWRKLVQDGNLLCAQIQNGSEVVSVGCLVIEAGVTEVAGIGTTPSFRGRGFASAVVSRLVREAWGRDDRALVWMSAATDSSQAIYERIGFRVVGHQVNYWMPNRAK